MKLKMSSGALWCALFAVSALAMSGRHSLLRALSGAPQAKSARSRERHDAGEKKAARQAQLAKQAKLTLEQAREIALKRAPGAVEEGELEHEHRKLVYSFDIRNDEGTITEVQVDAKTGKIVSVEEEDARQEAEEKRQEERERPNKKRPQ